MGARHIAPLDFPAAEARPAHVRPAPRRSGPESCRRLDLLASPVPRSIRIGGSAIPSISRRPTIFSPPPPPAIRPLDPPPPTPGRAFSSPPFLPCSPSALSAAPSLQDPTPRSSPASSASSVARSELSTPGSTHSWSSPPCPIVIPVGSPSPVPPSRHEPPSTSPGLLLGGDDRVAASLGRPRA